MRRLASLLLLLLAAAPLSARDLPVPADKGWQHAATGLILRSTLLGLPRTRLADSGDGEWDVDAQFNDPAVATSATVYVFHAAVPAVPIWFDRAVYALSHRGTYGTVVPAGPAVAFAPPRGDVPSALRQVFATGKGPYRSTGVAMMPLGPWLVAVRLSSTTLDPAALDAKLTTLIAELGWPARAPVRREPAAAVAPCPSALATRHARVMKPDMGQMLLGSTLASMAMKHAADAPAGTPDPAAAEPWCREGEATSDYAAYRKPSTVTGYLLAFGDAGLSADVYPGFALPPAHAGVSVTLHALDGTAATYPSFDALPQPRQVLELIEHGSPVSRVSASGDNTTISIDSKVLK